MSSCQAERSHGSPRRRRPSRSRFKQSYRADCGRSSSSPAGRPGRGAGPGANEWRCAEKRRARPPHVDRGCASVDHARQRGWSHVRGGGAWLPSSSCENVYSSDARSSFLLPGIPFRRDGHFPPAAARGRVRKECVRAVGCVCCVCGHLPAGVFATCTGAGRNGALQWTPEACCPGQETDAPPTVRALPVKGSVCGPRVRPGVGWNPASSAFSL